MTDEEAGQILKSIINHVDGNPVNLTRHLTFAFIPIKNQLSRDMDKYDVFVEKQRVNGAKGGRPRNPNNPSLSKKTQTNPNNLVTDTVTVNATDTDNVNEIINKPSPKAVSGVPYQKIVDLYHEKLPTLPRVEKLTATRKSQIRQRWLQDDLPDLNNWENFFDYVSQSKFLMGGSTPVNGHRVFTANLEWITKESNFIKICEKNYHGKI
jgi:hypothetical protein